MQYKKYKNQAEMNLTQEQISQFYPSRLLYAQKLAFAFMIGHDWYKCSSWLMWLSHVDKNVDICCY